jgi:hypothetical protein
MNKPASLVSKAKKKIRYGTLLHSFLGHLQQVGIVIHPYYLVREQCIAASDLQVSIEPKLDSLTTNFLAADEIDSVMRPLEEARAEKGYTARNRIADGCLCFGVKKEQEVIAYTWCDLKVCNHKPLPISLESSEAYLFDMYTFEECRGKNIAPFMRHELYSHLIEMGRTDFLSITDAFNSASKRFKGKLGAYPLKLYLYIKLGKLFERNFLLKSYE